MKIGDLIKNSIPAQHPDSRFPID